MVCLSSSAAKLAKYQKQFEDNFCLVVTRRRPSFDCFVFPFWEVAQYLSTARAWKVYIANGKVWFEVTTGSVFDVTRYYNAVRFLIEQPSGADQLEIVGRRHAKSELVEDLREKIAAFDELHASIVPTKRESVSNWSNVPVPLPTI